MLETHILRSQIDKGSNILLLLGDVHAAACGLQSKDCGPSMHPEDFVGSPSGLRHASRCFLAFLISLLYWFAGQQDRPQSRQHGQQYGSGGQQRDDDWIFQQFHCGSFRVSIYDTVCRLLTFGSSMTLASSALNSASVIVCTSSKMTMPISSARCKSWRRCLALSTA